MSARRRLIASLLCLTVLLSASSCTLSPEASPRSRQNERLGDVLGLDSSGRARLRGTVRSWSESTGTAEWSGRLLLALPAYVDGGEAEVLVSAEVDRRTEVADGSGAGGSAALSALIGRICEQRRVLDVVVSKEGSSLRALSVGSVGATGKEPPSLKGVLELDGGGRGTYRGRIAKLVSSVSSGVIWIEPRYRTQGIDVTVAVPLRWDERTSFVRAAGVPTPLPAALRSGAEPTARPEVEITFRRSPDGLVAETVTER